MEWQGRAGERGKLEHFGVWRFSFANPRTALWEFLQIYACLFAVMILARFRAHPFYIWRNQKSLLLIKTYFTAVFCSLHSHQMENANADKNERENLKKKSKIPPG